MTALAARADLPPDPAATSGGRTRLQDLIDLAAEPSSARRRELLREVTDLFFATEDTQAVKERGLFDAILTRLSGEMEAEVRAELALRMAPAAQPPKSLVRALAVDEIEIARPLLESPTALGPEDLVHVAERAPQSHLRLVSARPDVTAAVSDAVIRRADAVTLGVLVRNERAELSREGEEAVVTRALEDPSLHEDVVARKSLSLDLLHDMYFVVEAQLRQTIAQRTAEVDPGVLEAALAAGRRRLETRDGALPADLGEAEAHVRSLRRQNALTGATLVGFLRAGQRTRFLAALCELAELDFQTARRIVDRKDLDGLAIVCKAADLPRALFVTFAVLIADPGEGMGRAEEYGRLFADLPRDAALRTLRFWRMRRASGDIASA